jgi:hypothetical protein
MKILPRLGLVLLLFYSVHGCVALLPPARLGACYHCIQQSHTPHAQPRPYMRTYPYFYPQLRLHIAPGIILVF